MIKRIILWSVLIVVVALVVVYFARNAIVAKAIEEGGTRALGVETNLGSAGVSLTAGRLALRDLEVRNPKGFKSDNMLTIEHGRLDVVTGSIFSDEVVVDSLVLDGVTLNLEQIDNKGNYRVVMDHVRQFGSGSDNSGPKLKIKTLALRNIKVNGSFVLLGKPQYQKTLTLENYTMKNVGGKNGATISQVTARVVGTLLKRAAASGSNQLPGKLGEMLGQVSRTGIQKAEGDVKEQIKKLGGSLLGGDKK